MYYLYFSRIYDLASTYNTITSWKPNIKLSMFKKIVLEKRIRTRRTVTFRLKYIEGILNKKIIPIEVEFYFSSKRTAFIIGDITRGPILETLVHFIVTENELELEKINLIRLLELFSKDKLFLKTKTGLHRYSEKIISFIDEIIYDDVLKATEKYIESKDKYLLLKVIDKLLV